MHQRLRLNGWYCPSVWIGGYEYGVQMDVPFTVGPPPTRQAALDRLTGQSLDVLVVGGGINGAVSALALAAHGLKVGLVESGDFASGTSQESSNMVWGGFKYLESYDIGLVAGLCRSRNRLAAAYPTRLRETRFMAVLGADAPYAPWFAALGANAYWALGSLRTARPRHRTTQTINRLEPAVATAGLRGGIEYSDYLLPDNDARFVSEMVLESELHGAAVANYVALEAADRARSGWRVRLRDTTDGSPLEAGARVLVNAAGPKVPDLGSLTGTRTDHRLVYSKGVHLVVPQVTDSGRILAFFDDSQRLFYVLPMGGRSVVGTTDTPVEDPTVAVGDSDREFLLRQVAERLELTQAIGRQDVISTRCGVRSLVVPPGGSSRRRDWTELSRRHAVEVDAERAVVSILGGKLSDCLNVGKEVVRATAACGLAPMPPARPWYGEPSGEERCATLDRAHALGFDPEPAWTLWRRHGRRTREVLDAVAEDPGLGEEVSGLGGPTRAEVSVMGRHERIVRIEDFLRRRTMLSLMHRPEELASDPGIRLAAGMLLGDDGVRQLEAMGEGARDGGV